MIQNKLIMRLKPSSYILTFTILASALTSCYEDKGNYNYSETENIDIALIPGDTETQRIAAMKGSEYIELNPKVISSVAGEIDETNPNYEFGCRISYRHEDENKSTQRWYDINPDKTKNIKYFPTIPASDYTLWYTVKNKETGVVTSVTCPVKIISTTFEGWMVLSNNGTDNKTRLDMIFTDSKGIERVSKDIFEGNTPQMHDATALVINPTKTTAGDQIFLLGLSGGYKLNETTLQTTLADNIKVFDFMISSTPGEVVAWSPIPGGYAGGPMSRVCVTSEGNAHANHMGYQANAAFEYLMNTDYPGHDPMYKVAPYIGTSQNRPSSTNCALFYDITNKRFMGFDYKLEGRENRILFPLNDPSDRKFSFNTGMELVDMESTKFSEGVVYSVLQDNSGQRHVYAINMAGERINNSFVQENAYNNISATDFNTATDYAFHSQYPFMFYCRGNKVYCYNLGTGKITDTLMLDGSETVTKIKFNLFQSSHLTWLTDQSDEFMQQQYNLIVASTKGGEDSGIVRFYSISTQGKITFIKEFTGLGENIVDVTYRERINK